MQRQTGINGSYVEIDQDIVLPLYIRYRTADIFVINYSTSGRAQHGGVGLLSHPHFEIIAVKEGAVRYTFPEHQTIILDRHDILLIPPFVSHERTHITKGTLHSILLLIEGNITVSTDPYRIRRALDGPISDLLSLIDSESVHPGIESRTIITHAVSTLMPLILRAAPTLNAPSPSGTMRDVRFTAALEYIHRNIRADVTPSHVARNVGVTTRHLSRIFAAHGYAAPHRYMLDTRLYAAYAELLNDPSSTVREIANRFRFFDTNYFGKMMRKKFGMLPRAIQRNVH